jgi:hypothetical protein
MLTYSQSDETYRKRETQPLLYELSRVSKFVWALEIYRQRWAEIRSDGFKSHGASGLNTAARGCGVHPDRHDSTAAN